MEPKPCSTVKSLSTARRCPTARKHDRYSGSVAFGVCVLRSRSAGRRCVGQTDDLERRLFERNSIDHNTRKFTSKNLGPWIVIHSEERVIRSEAMQGERWLKSGVGREWLDVQFGRASPPQAD